MALILLLHPPIALSSSSSSSSSFTTNNKLHLLHTPNFTKISIKSKQQQDEKSGNSSAAAGSGFGSSSAKKKSSKRERERDSILRREPFEKPPSFATPQQAAQAEELRRNETAFLLAWLGLGAIILLQGIALAASGFLPEAWDKLFVKYVYPSFTPTVFLFVAGTTAYGVLKYLQNNNSNSNTQD